MFEAVKVVSPSSSLSLASPASTQLSTENNKDFSHFSQPHAVGEKKNHHHQSKSLAIDPNKPSRRQTKLLHFLSHILTHCKKSSENLVIYLKMIIFKERNRRTQQILVIFYSLMGDGNALNKPSDG